MNAKRVVGLLILIAGLALCGKGLWLLLVPSSYQATVEIEIQPDIIQDIPDNNGGAGNYAPYDPYFMETELRAMECDMVLSNAVQALSLDVKWGKRDGRQLGISDAIEMLRGSLTLDADRNTLIIDISVRDRDPEEAAQIANEIADSYGSYRIGQHRQRMEDGIKKLEENYQTEETNLLIMQSNVDRLRKKYGIRDTDPDSTTPGPSITTEQVQHLYQVLLEANTNAVRLQNQFARFQAIQEENPVALGENLITLFPDAVLSDLLERLHENEQTLEKLKSVHATTSIYGDEALSVNTKLKTQIKDRVAGIMMGLAANVQAQKDEVNALKQQIANLETKVGAENTRSLPYWEAKLRWRDARDLHQLLKQKIEVDKDDTIHPHTALVTVVEPAVPSKVPATANHWQGGIWLVCGLGLAGLGFFMLGSPKPRGNNNSVREVCRKADGDS